MSAVERSFEWQSVVAPREYLVKINFFQQMDKENHQMVRVASLVLPIRTESRQVRHFLENIPFLCMRSICSPLR